MIAYSKSYLFSLDYRSFILLLKKLLTFLLMYSDLKKGEYKNYSVGYTLIKFYTPFSIKEILQISSKMG